MGWDAAGQDRGVEPIAMAESVASHSFRDWVGLFEVSLQNASRRGSPDFLETLGKLYIFKVCVQISTWTLKQGGRTLYGSGQIGWRFA